MTTVKIILASTSPRRREIMELFGVPFTAVAPSFSETSCANLWPADEAKRFAYEKALSVTTQFADDLIIGCDTLIECEGRKIGKPADVTDAEKILGFLCGRTHRIYTAASLLHMTTHTHIEHLEIVDVTMHPVTADEITAYVATGESLDKAGAYAIQGGGQKLIAKVTGDYWSAVGLPAKWMAKALRKYGFVVKDVPNFEFLASPR